MQVTARLLGETETGFFGGSHKRYLRYFIAYTILCLLTGLIIFSWFYLNGKTLVWDADGLSQHFNALVYYRSWLRELFGNIFIHHKLEIPLWNMNIGYGSDIITTLHYYVIGEPLDVLAAFVPKKSDMDLFYTGLVVFRIYLAGLSFSAYSLYHKNRAFPTLMGSLIYIYGDWTLVALRHPFFLTPLIFLPLVLLGMDKIYNREKSWLYILSLAFAVLSSFYFGYMICVFVIVYAIFRYLMLFRKIEARRLLFWIGKFISRTVVAIAMAAVIFLPVVAFMFSTQRANQQSFMMLFYPKYYYLQFISAFIIGQSDYFCFMGYTAFGLLGVILLFLQHKENRVLKIAFIFLTVCLMIPYVGHAINGFGYISNRFVWIYGMLVAYIFVKTYPSLKNLSQKKSRILFLSILVYAIACFVNWRAQQEMAMTALVCLCLLAMWLFQYGFRWLQENRIICFRAVIAGGLIACLAIQARYNYSATEEEYAGEFLEVGSALTKLTDDAPEYILKAVSDKSIWRYDSYLGNFETGTATQNSALQLKENGVSYYWSLADGNVNQFQREMYLNQDRDYSYNNLDGRTILDALAAVKYYVVHGYGINYLPYNYSYSPMAEQQFTTGEYTLHENYNALPIAYTYTSYIPRSQYESLWVTKKQQALLQGCVLDSPDTSVPKTNLTFNDVRQYCSVTAGSGVTVKDGKITVLQKHGTVTLHFSGDVSSETYFVLEGLAFRNLKLSEAYTPEEWALLTLYQQNAIKAYYSNRKQSDEALISISDGSVKKQIEYLTEQNNFYTGIHDFLVNVGYNEGNPVTDLTITFDKRGVYTYDNMSVVCQPMSNINTEVSQLKQNVLEHVSMSDNRISGDIHLGQPKILCFSIPYSKGWTAYVDGEKTELKRANTMYMALDLSSGYHKVVLKYETPYLKKGLMVSAAGICVFLIICIAERKKMKQRGKGFKD